MLSPNYDIRKTNRSNVWKMKETIIFVLLFSYAISKKIDLKKTKIYGPGLYPQNLVLPVRYFFIQPYDEEGNR